MFLRLRESWAGEVINHLAHWKRKLKLSRSSGPLIAVGGSSPPPTNSRKATVYPEPSSWSRWTLWSLHKDWQCDRQMAHILTALPPHWSSLSMLRKDEKCLLEETKEGKEGGTRLPKERVIEFALLWALPFLPCNASQIWALLLVWPWVRLFYSLQTSTGCSAPNQSSCGWL